MPDYIIKLDGLKDSMHTAKKYVKELSQAIYKNPLETAGAFIFAYSLNGCASKSQEDVAKSALEDMLSANKSNLSRLYEYDSLPAHIKNLKAQFEGNKLIVGEDLLGYDTLDVSIERSGNNKGDSTYTFVMPNSVAYTNVTISVDKDGNVTSKR